MGLVDLLQTAAIGPDQRAQMDLISYLYTKRRKLPCMLRNDPDMCLAQSSGSVLRSLLNNEVSNECFSSFAASRTCCNAFCWGCKALPCSSGDPFRWTLPVESPPGTAKLPAASSSIARIVGAFGFVSSMNCIRHTKHGDDTFSWQLLPPAGPYTLIYCAVF